MIPAEITSAIRIAQAQAGVNPTAAAANPEISAAPPLRATYQRTLEVLNAITVAADAADAANTRITYAELADKRGFSARAARRHVKMLYATGYLTQARRSRHCIIYGIKADQLEFATTNAAANLLPQPPAIVTPTASANANQCQCPHCDHCKAQHQTQAQAPAPQATPEAEAPAAAKPEPPRSSQACPLHGQTRPSQKQTPDTVGVQVHYCPVKDPETDQYCSWLWCEEYGEISPPGRQQLANRQIPLTLAAIREHRILMQASPAWSSPNIAVAPAIAENRFARAAMPTASPTPPAATEPSTNRQPADLGGLFRATPPPETA